MLKRSFLVIALASVTAIVFHPGFDLRGAQTPAVALHGQVSSAEEGPMEGVLVGAQKAGSTVTITVASDQQGRYQFPWSKLEPGRYSLKIRAVGYELDGSGTAEIRAQKTATLNLKLRKAKDLASQLSNAEWLVSFPGTEQQKNSLLDCTTCHTLERVVRSSHNTDELIQVMKRMSSYSPGSQPMLPQKRVVAPEANGNGERFRKTAEYLSTLNLSAVSHWEYPLKTFSRTTGRGTHVIITEYDLPRRVSQPHDVILDSKGMVWYGDFGQQYIGKLDPKTGKATEYTVPELKHGAPLGNLDLEFDKDGYLWTGLMLQGGIAKFDPKTEKFQFFPLPPEINSDVAQQAMVMPAHYDIDGKVWMNNVGIQGIHRLDLKSGKFETFQPYKKLAGDGRTHTVYGIAADSQNNLYFLDFRDESIGRVDARNGETKLLRTPTRGSRPRRGHMDSQDRLWFAEFEGNKIAMFDTKTERFQEWAAPTPFSAPYDVVLDKNGEVWAGGMSSDRIMRLDTKSGKIVEYALPRETNIRRVFVDNSTTPVTFWVGSDHGGSIIKVEPLD